VPPLTAAENASMRIFVLAGVAFAVLAAGSLSAGVTGVVSPQARVFVDPAQGFDVFLTAALRKANVPFTVIADRTQAQYEIGAIRNGKQTGVKMVDLKNGQVIFAYSVERKSLQAAADQCAKQLRTVIKPRATVHNPTGRLGGWLAQDPAFNF
jgi:hypothetical protein